MTFVIRSCTVLEMLHKLSKVNISKLCYYCYYYCCCYYFNFYLHFKFCMNCQAVSKAEFSCSLNVWISDWNPCLHLSTCYILGSWLCVYKLITLKNIYVTFLLIKKKKSKHPCRSSMTPNRVTIPLLKTSALKECISPTMSQLQWVPSKSFKWFMKYFENIHYRHPFSTFKAILYLCKICSCTKWRPNMRGGLNSKNVKFSQTWVCIYQWIFGMSLCIKQNLSHSLLK